MKYQHTYDLSIDTKQDDATRTISADKIQVAEEMAPTSCIIDCTFAHLGSNVPIDSVPNAVHCAVDGTAFDDLTWPPARYDDTSDAQHLRVRVHFSEGDEKPLAVTWA